MTSSLAGGGSTVGTLPPTPQSTTYDLLRRITALTLFVLLLVGGFRPMFLRLIVSRRYIREAGPVDGVDRRPLREKNDPTSPELQAFLFRIRDATRPGDSVALVFTVPPHDGWSYSYWRSNYVLSGRRVLYPGETDANVIAYWPAAKIERRR